MNITNYKYNETTFEKEAYEKLKEREKHDKALIKEEKKINRNVSNIRLSYYQAYLRYMHADNEHMATFLPYIKHEYEMMKRTKPLFFNDDEMTIQLDKHIDRCVEAFNLYYGIYNDLNKIEFELKEAIDSFQSQMFKEDMMNLMSLHLILNRLNDSYLVLHTTAEEYRQIFGFPFVEECLALRNVGLKFETYQKRSERIVKEAESQPEA